MEPRTRSECLRIGNPERLYCSSSFPNPRELTRVGREVLESMTSTLSGRHRHHPADAANAGAPLPHSPRILPASSPDPIPQSGLDDRWGPDYCTPFEDLTYFYAGRQTTSRIMMIASEGPNNEAMDSVRMFQSWYPRNNDLR